MTKKHAYGILNLGTDATAEDIDRAYKRLVRRYPPEFHPERFREVDDAYRFLTSLSRRLEHAFNSHTTGRIDSSVFDYKLVPPEEPLPCAMKELRLLARISYLWAEDSHDMS